MNINSILIPAIITSITTLVVGLVTLFTNSYWSKKSSKQRFSIEFQRYCQEDKEFTSNKAVITKLLSKCMIDNTIILEMVEKEIESIIEYISAVKESRKEKNNAMILESINRKYALQIKEFESLVFVFNVWERCANAIKNDIYDEKIIYEVQSSSLILLYNKFYTYIENARERAQNNNIYSDLEWLAIRWAIKKKMIATKNKKKFYNAIKYGRNLILDQEKNKRIKLKIALIRLERNRDVNK